MLSSLTVLEFWIVGIRQHGEDTGLVAFRSQFGRQLAEDWLRQFGPPDDWDAFIAVESGQETNYAFPVERDKTTQTFELPKEETEYSHLSSDVIDQAFDDLYHMICELRDKPRTLPVVDRAALIFMQRMLDEIVELAGVNQ